MALFRRMNQSLPIFYKSKIFSSRHHLSAAVAESAKAKLDAGEVPTLREFLTLDDRKRKRRSLEQYTIPNFDEYLSERSIPFKRTETTTLQVNIGLHCNQSCNHCHVESSPQRKEMMTRDTTDRLLYLLENNESVTTVDITGGAPELNQEFRYFVENIRKMKPNITIIDRCNLTVLYEDGQEDLKEFLAANKVHFIN